MKKISFLFVVIIVFNLSATQISVPKDFSKIQAAIDKAEQGDTVFISSGIYRESITMKDSVNIIGQSAQNTIIKGNKREPVIKAGDKALIKNLTVERGSKGILCENVIPVIRNCIIRDNKGTGIHCLVTIADICNNVILSNDWTGIFCESTRSIKSSIKHNVIAENGYCGIMLAGSSEVLIQNNVIIDNMQYGVYAEESSKKSRIIYNDFFRNRTAHNYFAIVDKSNISEDPQYPVKGALVISYFESSPQNLKGKGKDGETIGIINETELLQMMNDPDIDGVPGEKDLCKDIPEDIDHFQDEDGCPDFDNDNDGIYDHQDLCPDSAEDMDNFRDDDGCPDLDNDKDGVIDTKDLCPGNVEIINGYKDDDGCPDEVPAGNPVNSGKNESLKNVPAEPQKTDPVQTETSKANNTENKVEKDSIKVDTLKQAAPVNK